VRLARQGIDDVVGGGQLVLRQPLGGERCDFVDVGGDTGDRFEHCLDLLAHVGVRDAERRRITDRRMLHEHRFDLGGIHVRAGDENQIDPPISEVEETVGIEPSQIADGEMTVRQLHRRGLVGVTVAFGCTVGAPTVDRATSPTGRSLPSSSMIEYSMRGDALPTVPG